MDKIKINYYVNFNVNENYNKKILIIFKDRNN